VSWQSDGRHGIAIIAGVRREGFAILRDRVNKLIAFHADSPPSLLDLDERQRAMEDFTIPEADFEAVLLVPEEKK
jgi:hypothetical protein